MTIKWTVDFPSLNYEYICFDGEIESSENSPVAKRFAWCKFKNDCMRKLDQPQKVFQHLIRTVLEPKQVGMVREGVSVSSEYKIRKLVEVIKVFTNSPNAVDCPDIVHSKVFQWRDLVHVILFKGASVEAKQRARFALLLLEQVDVGLSAFNYQITKLMDSHDKKAYRRLDRWMRLRLDPLQLSFPMKAHAISNNLPDYSPLLSKDWHPKEMPLNSFWKSKKVVMGNPSHEVTQCYFDNIQAVAKIEGFPEPQLFGFEWMRDLIIIRENKRPLISAPMNFGDKASFMNLVHQLLGSPDEHVIGKGIKEADAMRGYTKISEAPFCFEGGNLIPAINRSGQKIYLCGASNILFSVLNSQFLFSSERRKKSLLNEMQSLFLEEDLSSVQACLERGGLLVDFDDQEKRVIARLTLATISYLKKKMAESLHCPVLVLGNVFEAQPEFHLDMFMMPAPNGTIYMQDHNFSCEVIKKIQEHYSLKPDEIDRLNMYLRAGQELQEKYGERLKQISDDLQKNGFDVIPVPGVFYDYNGKSTVNFLNSIVGVGKEENFCITNGSSHPVDRFLRDAFNVFLNHYGIPRVYFTGRETDVEVSKGRLPTNVFLGADISLGDFGGIHCRTLTVDRSFSGIYLGKHKKERTLPLDEAYAGEMLPQFYAQMLKKVPDLQ